jgi:hypothetical protein
MASNNMLTVGQALVGARVGWADAHSYYLEHIHAAHGALILPKRKTTGALIMGEYIGVTVEKTIDLTEHNAPLHLYYVTM